MKRIAVFPGTFDPITKGHESVIRRALPLFDEIIIAIGINPEKQSLFSLEKRMGWIKQIFKNEDKIKVDSYTGLTVDYCKIKNAKYILRGLRGNTDFEFERSIAMMNKEMVPEIETIFMLAMPEYIAFNSSIVRNIYQNGGDTKPFVPKGIDLNK